MNDRHDVIVIGAGANGLAAAATLGRAGLAVIVLEQSGAVGGLQRTVEFAPGFHATPTAADDGWLPPAMARDLGLGVPVRTIPDIPLTVALAPGDVLPLARESRAAAEAIRRHSARDAATWPAFTAQLHKLAGFLAVLYQRPAPDIATTGLRDLASLLRVALGLRALGRADMAEFLRIVPMSVRELLDDRFECEALKAAVAAGAVRDLRQGPRSGGTGFVLLHYLVGAAPGSVRDRGYCRDGPETCVAALDALARRNGVTIRTDTAVSRILVRDDAVTGVALASGAEVSAPRVLSTADPAATFLGLVDPVWLDPELLHAVRNIKFRGAAAVVLYALDSLPQRGGLPAASLAGVVTLTPQLDALERAADAAKYGNVSEHPHVEISAPSIRWPAVAPPGKHVVVARVQYAPHCLKDGNGWDGARREALADRVSHLIDTAVPGFLDRVLHRAMFTPADFEARYGVTEGALTHGELTLDQVLFMRPIPGLAHYATPLTGLYLGGAGTHPGPGVMGGGGWLAARRLLQDGTGP
ncbi:MAG: NAD(P)/FAD-dependent oxidoreductase [Gemmatimonadota bacterium]|nr:NAD(P)/FAD-dependent oxidoreductase [Gemmatimonadota bacterium]